MRVVGYVKMMKSAAHPTHRVEREEEEEAREKARSNLSYLSCHLSQPFACVVHMQHANRSTTQEPLSPAPAAAAGIRSVA